ncbi:MAG: polysaccharide biosynthesis C-terminal domain-containing protein [Candidatus Woesearchaeota archaeon]
MKKVYVRITRQIGFSYFSTVLLFLVSPLLVVLLTRNLSVSHYGIYSILAVTVGVAGVLLDLGLSQYIISRLAGIQPKERTRAFLTLSTFLMLFLVAVMALILFTPIQGVLLSWLRLTGYVPEFRIALAIILCVTLIRLFTSYLTAKKHLVLVNLVFLMSQALWVLLLLGAFAITRAISLLSVMIWWFVGVLITLLVCGVLMRREFRHVAEKGTWQPKVIIESLLFSIPLLAFITGSWAIEIGNRYLLNGMLGSEAVGLFTLVYSLLGVIASFGNVVSQTFFPYIAAAWNQKKDHRVYLNAAVKYSLIIIIPAITGFLALRNEIITLVSGEQYLEAANIIPWLLLYPILASLNYIIYQIVLLRRRTFLIGATYGIGAVINIALNILLIPKFSMTGSAIATVASYGFVFLVLVWDARKSLRIDNRFIKIGRTSLAAAIMGVAVWLVHPATALTKIGTMAGGAVLYFLLLFFFRVFSEKELELVAGMLPAPFRRLLPRLSS